jgi:GST-like protein
MPADAADRWRAVQWLMFQMGGVGPMFGQVGFFNVFAGKDWDDKRPLERYVTEARRLLGVMDGALAGKSWFLGDDYTIADVAMLPWAHHLICYYGARDLVAFDSFTHVRDWLERGLARPAVQRGFAVYA